MKGKRAEISGDEEEMDGFEEVERLQDEEDPVSVRVMYVCEDCDYRWQQDVEPKMKESYSDPEELDVHDIKQTCPICGSRSIDLDEG